jgi:hypothetical protein
MGQLVPDTAAAHAAQRTLVLEEARRQGDTALVARLASPGAMVKERDLFAVGGEMRNATSFWPLLRTGLMAPEYTLFDAWNVRRGAVAERHLRTIAWAICRLPSAVVPVFLSRPL